MVRTGSSRKTSASTATSTGPVSCHCHVQRVDSAAGQEVGAPGGTVTCCRQAGTGASSSAVSASATPRRGPRRRTRAGRERGTAHAGRIRIDSSPDAGGPTPPPTGQRAPARSRRAGQRGVPKSCVQYGPLLLATPTPISVNVQFRMLAR